MPGEQLRVLDGPSAGQEVLLGDEFTVGRNEQGDGNLGSDPEISRLHARIRRTPAGGIEIEDLGSTNGTFVNDTRIDGPRQLNPGDTVRMGTTTLKLEDPQATAISARPVLDAPPTEPVAVPPTPPPVAAPPPPPVAVPPPPPPPQVVFEQEDAGPPGPPPKAASGGEGRPRWFYLVLAAAAAAGAAIVVIALSGGGGKSSDSSAASSTAAAIKSAVSKAANTAANTAPAPTSAPGGLTPIGSTLKLGQPAVIAYDDASSHDKSTIQITPDAIQQGSISDFKNVQLDANQKNSTPYYVNVSVKNVGKGDLSGDSPANYLDGVDDRGQAQQAVIFFGDFSRCSSVDPKSLKPGQSYKTCETFLIPKGGSLKGMRWVVFDQKTGKEDLNWK